MPVVVSVPVVVPVVVSVPVVVNASDVGVPVVMTVVSSCVSASGGASSCQCQWWH